MQVHTVTDCSICKAPRCKMSRDRNQLLAFLNDVGITPVLAGDKVKGFTDAPEGNDVRLVADNGNVEGYGDFYCEFKFDDTGKFMSVGVWE